MSDIAKYFIDELVVGFGFLNGVWIALGVNPITEILNTFDLMLKTLNPESGLGLLPYLLQFLILIISIAMTYLVGGKLGFVAVGCSFIGGLLVLAVPLIAGILLLCGLGLGLVAVATAGSTRSDEAYGYSYY